MADSETDVWLIVQTRLQLDDQVTALLPGLAHLGIDAATARQRLIGQGPALLGKGPRKDLEKIAEFLRSHQTASWIVPPPQPEFTPERVFSLHAAERGIVFTCRNTKVIFPNGSQAVAILADLSGRIRDKLLQRLQFQMTYLGSDSANLSAEDEIYREVLCNEPVLDLYLLSPAGRVENAVRLIPGSFDPQGLGKEKTYNAGGNLAAILKLLARRAFTVTLHTTFGLAFLPGCRPKAWGETSRREMMAALDRFGWLVADLERSRLEAVKAPAEEVAGGYPTPLSAGEALPPAQPVLACSPADGIGIQLTPASPDKWKEPSAPVRRPVMLPPPPMPDNRNRRFGPARNPVFALLLVLVAAGTGPSLFLPLLSFTWRHLAQTGWLAAGLSTSLVLVGVQFLRWKRQAENTPTCRVRSLAMGMVEVHGRAVRKYALVSPTTRQPCVWHPSSDGNGSAPFYLDDGTGKVLVDPQGAAFQFRSGEQGVIPEGAHIYVLGFARSHRPDKFSLAERTREKLRWLKTDPQALRHFDADGDGRISTEEWDRARRHVEQETLGDHLMGELRRSADSVVIGRPPTRALPFIIAHDMEVRLTGRYGWTAVALLAGGLLLAGWAAAIILPKFIP